MLNLTDKAVVVVGGGKIAVLKISRLHNAGAKVTVISPEITSEIDEKRIRWLAQPYSFDALSRCYPVLVFAATDSENINQQVAADSRRIGAWVNVLSDSDASDFHNMAIIEQAPLTIGISTNGTSPAFLKTIKAKIEAALGQNLHILAQWLGEIRSDVKVNIDRQAQRQQIYEQIVQSDVLDLLQAGEIESARAKFDVLLAEVLI